MTSVDEGAASRTDRSFPRRGWRGPVPPLSAAQGEPLAGRDMWAARGLLEGSGDASAGRGYLASDLTCACIVERVTGIEPA
jgi:hypothetical protein